MTFPVFMSPVIEGLKRGLKAVFKKRLEASHNKNHDK